MFMEYFFLLVGIAILVLAFMILSRFTKAGKTGDESAPPAPGFVTCPVCGMPLSKGENLHSKIFRPMTTPDQRMTVQGCPHCYPRVMPGISRRCPVCGKPLSLDDELVARLFNRTDNKKHVMILGCSKCMSLRARD